MAGYLCGSRALRRLERQTGLRFVAAKGRGGWGTTLLAKDDRGRLWWIRRHGRNYVSMDREAETPAYAPAWRPQRPPIFCADLGPLSHAERVAEIERALGDYGLP